jgi:hypothetical protein
MSAFDPAPSHTVQRALPVGTRIEGIEVGPAIAEDAATVTYRATGPRGEFLVLTEYLPAQIAMRDADGAVLSVSDAAFRAGLGAFMDEARVLMRCDHPSLIAVLALIEARGTAYCTSRWVDATRLVDVRRQMTEPPDEEALRDLLEALLGGLNAWQREAGLHGAVTPTNILLLASDRPLLLGPGKAAQAIASERVASLMTSVEPSFAPVEQLAPTADLPLGPTADYYALAGVMRYCISGQLPPPALAGDGVPRESMRDLARRVRQSWPRLHYGEVLLDTLEAALSHRPEDRPQSVAQFRAWLNTGPENAGPQRVAPPPRPTAAAPPITIDPIDMLGAAPATPPPAASSRPGAPRRTAARAAPTIDLPGGFATLGSIPAPEQEQEAVSSFFGIDPGDGPGDRFDHFERFDRIDDHGRHSTTPARPAPPKRRRWGVLTASVIGVLLVIGGVAGVREYDRRLEADRTLEIARGSMATPDDRASAPLARMPAPAAPAAAPRREMTLPTEPTAAGPPPAGANVTAPLPQNAPPPTVQAAPQIAPQGPINTPAAQQPSPAPRQTVPQPPVSPAPPMQQPTEGAAATPPPANARAPQSSVPTVQAQAPVQTPPRAAAAPRPAPAPESPREVCGPRSDFSLYRCMTQQCALPQWRFHAQCDRLRRFDRVD